MLERLEKVWEERERYRLLRERQLRAEQAAAERVLREEEEAREAREARANSKAKAGKRK